MDTNVLVIKTSNSKLTTKLAKSSTPATRKQMEVVVTNVRRKEKDHLVDAPMDMNWKEIYILARKFIHATKIVMEVVIKSVSETAKEIHVNVRNLNGYSVRMEKHVTRSHHVSLRTTAVVLRRVLTTEMLQYAVVKNPNLNWVQMERHAIMCTHATERTNAKRFAKKLRARTNSCVNVLMGMNWQMMEYHATKSIHATNQTTEVVTIFAIRLTKHSSVDAKKDSNSIPTVSPVHSFIHATEVKTVVANKLVSRREKLLSAYVVKITS
jgi:creatinine amidohydrolase/Fe(II)-dependent formamide hydrolase-like protein